MAGYDDTRQMIISTLMGRPVGTEIQPENQQAYELNILDYIRSLELLANGPLIGIATSDTQPVQPNGSRVCYIAGVAQDRTVTFQNFRNYLGQPIQITNGEMESCLVILIWDTQYWSAETVPTSIISQADQAYYYYNLMIRKTYSSVAAMNDDSVNPIGTDGRLIKIGETVTVVNSTTPAENGFYSYEGSENGWSLQSGFSFEIAQTTGTDINKTMSQKAITDEIEQLTGDVRQITKSYKLFNYSEGWLAITGETNYGETTCNTDFLPYSGGDILVNGISGETAALLLFYDSEKTLIGHINGVEKNETLVLITEDNIPSGTVYIRATGRKVNGKISKNNYIDIINVHTLYSEVNELNLQVKSLKEFGEAHAYNILIGINNVRPYGIKERELYYHTTYKKVYEIINNLAVDYEAQEGDVFIFKGLPLRITSSGIDLDYPLVHLNEGIYYEYSEGVVTEALSVAGYMGLKFDVKRGDVLCIKTFGGNAARAFVYQDKYGNDVLVAPSEADHYYVPEIIECTVDGIVYVSCQPGRTPGVYCKSLIEGKYEKIKELTSDVRQITKSYKLFNYSEGWLAITGETNYGETTCNTDFLPYSGGDILVNGISGETAALLLFYDSEKTLIGHINGVEKNETLVLITEDNIPSGTVYIRATGRKVNGKISKNNYIDIINVHTLYSEVNELNLQVKSLKGIEGAIYNKLDLTASEIGYSKNYNLSSIWEQGALTDADGLNGDPASDYYARRIRTKTFIDNGITNIKTKYGYSVILYKYQLEGDFIEYTIGKSFELSSAYKYRIALKRDGDTNITPDEFEAIYLVSDPLSDPLNKQSFWKKNIDFGSTNIHGYYRGLGNDYSAFNSSTMTSEIYQAFDSLVDASNGYITKSILGVCSDGIQNVNLYTLKPPTEPYRMITKIKPKILLLQAQHGFEKSSVFGAYYFIHDLINKWHEHPILDYIRHHIEIQIIPVVNPYGFDNNLYKNYNGVNLNRNFLAEGTSQSVTDPTSSQYGGEVAFDQPETQYIRDWVLANKDALVFIDHHTLGSGLASDIGKITWHSYYEGGDDYFNHMFDVANYHICTITAHFNKDYNLGYNNVLFGFIDSGFGEGGTSGSWVSKQGIIGVTLEGFNGFPDEPAAYSNNAKKANSELLGNYLAAIIAKYASVQ